MNNGWVCPSCGYSWAIWVEGCKNCNRPEHEKTGSATGVNWVPGVTQTFKEGSHK